MEFVRFITLIGRWCVDRRTWVALDCGALES
ncbi:hypothetical protein LINPERHAP1_LOCUS19290 [Linum perenne]